MRARNPVRTVLAIAACAALVFAAVAATAQGDVAEDELLTHFVLKGQQPLKPLPKIGVLPSLASDIEDVTIHGVVRRDLDLCGEFEVLDDDQAPDALYLSDAPVDVEAWKKVGAEAVVKVSGKKLPSGKVELKGVAYFTDEGDAPVFKKTFIVDATRVRAESHRVADTLIGALTGTDGSFSSQLTFVYGHGKQRRVYVIDADGHDPQPVSPIGHVALAPAFGPEHKLYYAASVDHDAYKIFEQGKPDPIATAPRGSVYGIAFSRDKARVALSIADGPNIKLFSGESFDKLEQVGSNTMALAPAFSPTGKIAYSGQSGLTQRVFIDGKAISPAGLHSTSPTFCRHPDGIRAVYAVGVGKHMDLVSTGELGGNARRLTAGAGENNYAACSPDGRLVAFFSTRKSGPGLYVMRLDGRRPKRISTLVGDSLQWSRLPTP